jgi:hypothetical protein
VVTLEIDREAAVVRHDLTKKYRICPTDSLVEFL